MLWGEEDILGVEIRIESAGKRGVGGLFHMLKWMNLVKR